MDTANHESGGLAMANGQIFVLALSERIIVLVALDAVSGSQHWRLWFDRDLDVPPWEPAPVVAGDMVFITIERPTDKGTNHRLIAVDAVTGTKKWSADYALGAWGQRLPVAGGGVVVLAKVGESRSDVITFDAATRVRRRTFEAVGQTRTEPVMAAGVLYFTTDTQALLDSDFSIMDAGATLYAVEITTEQLLWRQDLGMSSTTYPLVSGEYLYVVGDAGRNEERYASVRPEVPVFTCGAKGRISPTPGIVLEPAW